MYRIELLKTNIANVNDYFGVIKSENWREITSEFVIEKKKKIKNVEKDERSSTGYKNNSPRRQSHLNDKQFFSFPFFFVEEDLDDVMFGKTTRHRPEELKSLERSTKFTRKEIQLIYRGFKQVKFIFYFSNYFICLSTII